VKIGLSSEGKNIDWECLKTASREEYLDLKLREQKEGGAKRQHAPRFKFRACLQKRVPS
jgi:hypothetical protein